MSLCEEELVDIQHCFLHPICKVGDDTDDRSDRVDLFSAQFSRAEYARVFESPRGGFRVLDDLLRDSGGGFSLLLRMYSPFKSCYVLSTGTCARGERQ